MTAQYLDLEVRFLVLKYGYSGVIKALAKVKGVSEENILSAILDFEKSNAVKQKKSKKSISEIVEKLLEKAPDKSGMLRELASRFENKTFLSQMKDVRHFLAPFGVDPKSLKSRTSSVAKIFEKLSELPSNELQELIANVPSGESIFSELASEIMGDRKKSDASST